MTTINLTIKGQKIELSLLEAENIYSELDILFGGTRRNIPFQPVYPINPISPTPHPQYPWEQPQIICSNEKPTVVPVSASV